MGCVRELPSLSERAVEARPDSGKASSKAGRQNRQIVRYMLLREGTGWLRGG